MRSALSGVARQTESNGLSSVVAIPTNRQSAPPPMQGPTMERVGQTERSHDASKKRRRDAQTEAATEAREVPTEAREVPPHVFVSCFDECDRLVEVDTRVLASADCRLYKQIQYDPPSHEHPSGKPFWRCNMTRAMLQTFMRSLQHGELSLSKTVSVAEAMTTFEYENVHIGVPAERRGDVARSVACVRAPAKGAVFQKRFESLNQIILHTSEQIAHAIARWPRLETCLDAALSGASPATSTTATRAWVRFCKKPSRVPVAYEGREWRNELPVVMARKWSVWLQKSLVSLGMLFAKLDREKVVSSFLSDWNEKAFNALVTLVQADQLGWFLFTVHDWPRRSMDKHQRRELLLGEQFANQVRQAVLEGADIAARHAHQSTQQAAGDGGAPSQPSAPPLTPRHLFARACVTLAEQIVNDSPSPATMYSGVCADDNGKTPERSQLQRSLAQRGIKLVRWHEGDDRGAPLKPLVFPSTWVDAVGTGAASACMLLDFGERR